MRIAGCILALCLGCSSNDPKPSSDTEDEAAEATTAEEQPEQDDPTRRRRRDSNLDRGLTDEEIQAQIERAQNRAADSAEERDEARDFNREFEAALGNPIDCVRDYKGDEKKRIRIQLSAMVRPTGRVGQVEVSGGGVSDDARRCLRRRAEAIRLAPLDDGQTRARAQATVEFDYEPERIIEGEPPDWDPIQPGQRKPSEPQQPTIAPSGTPIQKEPALPPPPPSGTPIQGPKGQPIRGPQGIPIGQ